MGEIPGNPERPRSGVTPTVKLPGHPTLLDRPATRAASESSLFSTGQIVGGRYRIVELLGTGGMGEVYRAEDLTLGQTVALKFLINSAEDTSALDQMVREVKVARRVAHPNTCRVFDIGSADGLPFLSMEYVDGEDLASLLHRIGRLPADKAVELARQLAMGLAAVHEQGVLHRDLKPANVMIDGEGRARLTDFGIAAVTNDRPDSSVAGTPAYMAPELFTGGATTVASDLYSFGLVLYELFTGRPMFAARSMTELLDQHRRPLPTLSEQIEGVDPMVERVMAQCLDHDPRRRPRSALQVAASLPGGDPLAAAMAAGETPAPELVAASGGRGPVPVLAIVALLTLVVALVATVVMSGTTTLFGQQTLPRSAEVLAAMASDHLERLGLPERADASPPAPHRHVAFGFEVNEKLVRRAATADGEGPGPIAFWYRSSPRPLLTTQASQAISWSEPAASAPGMVRLRLDPRGRLLELAAVPLALGRGAVSEGEAAELTRRPEPDWRPFFEAAGLDAGEFREVTPQLVPRSAMDRRRAWVAADGATRVEAASFEGTPVAFTAVSAVEAEPGDRDDATEVALSRTDPDAGRGPWGDALQLLLLVGAVVLAWRNLRAGSVDRPGARRATLAITVIAAAGILLRADHVADLAAEMRLTLGALTESLVFGLKFWVFYAAVEPHVRRRWPELMIGWTRLLRGDARNPLVGLNILVGVTLGVVAFALVLVDHKATCALGWPAPAPLYSSDWGPLALLGLRQQAGILCEAIVRSHFFVLSFLLGIVLARLLLGHRRYAIAAFVVVQTAVWGAGSMQTPLSWAICATLAVLCSVVLVRLGMLALLAAGAIFLLLATLPLNADIASWQFGATAFTALLALGAGLFGAWYAGLRVLEART